MQKLTLSEIIAKNRAATADKTLGLFLNPNKSRLYGLYSFSEEDQKGHHCAIGCAFSEETLSFVQENELNAYGLYYLLDNNAVQIPDEERKWARLLQGCHDTMLGIISACDTPEEWYIDIRDHPGLLSIFEDFAVQGKGVNTDTPAPYSPADIERAWLSILDEIERLSELKTSITDKN